MTTSPTMTITLTPNSADRFAWLLRGDGFGIAGTGATIEQAVSLARAELAGRIAPTPQRSTEAA